MKTINKFRGEYWFLSNFYPSPFVYQFKEWPTSEHLYMSHKTFDKDLREQIRKSDTPGKAKRIGRELDLRSDWEDIKISVMKKCLLLKFGQNYDIQKKLIKTGDTKLIEGNTWHDNVWGDCSCEKCKYISGQNLLGMLLGLVRSEFQ